MDWGKGRARFCWSCFLRFVFVSLSFWLVEELGGGMVDGFFFFFGWNGTDDDADYCGKS